MILFHIFIFSKYVYLLPFNFTFPNLFIIFICLYSLSFSAQIKTDSPFPVLSVFGDPGICYSNATYLTIHTSHLADKKSGLACTIPPAVIYLSQIIHEELLKL